MTSASPARTPRWRSRCCGCCDDEMAVVDTGAGRGGSQRRPGHRGRRRHDPGARQGSHRGGAGRPDRPASAGGEPEGDGVALPVPVLRHDRSVRRARAGARVHRGQGGGDHRAAPRGRRARRRPGWPSCAREAAARFAAGGRLLAFGNGGSATDAQQLATLFLNPGGGRRAAARVRAGQRHVRGHRAVQRHRRGRGLRPADRRLRRPQRHRGRAVDQRQLRQPAARLRRGEPARACSPSASPATRAARWPSWTASTTCSWRLVVGAPDPGGADHDLPGAVGARRDLGVDRTRIRRRCHMCLGIPVR